MVGSHVTANDNTENNFEPSIFPPMTDIETKCMLEWGENGDLDLNVTTLYNILKKHLNNAEGHTYTDRIKSLNFTVVNGSVFNNPFVQILTMFYLKQVNYKDKEKDIEKYESMNEDINKNIIKFWNQLLDYLNLNE
tara:strand:- start:833 stop:1240 length:408 start_codon:yes stop_codon:yes gene_type:complete